MHFLKDKIYNPIQLFFLKSVFKFKENSLTLRGQWWYIVHLKLKKAQTIENVIILLWSMTSVCFYSHYSHSSANLNTWMILKLFASVSFPLSLMSVAFRTNQIADSVWRLPPLTVSPSRLQFCLPSGLGQGNAFLFNLCLFHRALQTPSSPLPFKSHCELCCLGSNLSFL